MQHYNTPSLPVHWVQESHFTKAGFTTALQLMHRYRRKRSLEGPSGDLGAQLTQAMEQYRKVRQEGRAARRLGQAQDRYRSIKFGGFLPPRHEPILPASDERDLDSKFGEALEDSDIEDKEESVSSSTSPAPYSKPPEPSHPPPGRFTSDQKPAELLGPAPGFTSQSAS